MEVEFFQDLVDRIGWFAVLVNSIECVACSLYRQRRDLEGLAARGDGGDPGGDAKTNITEPSQLIHNAVDLPCVCPLRIENRFSIVEDYEHLLGG